MTIHFFFPLRPSKYVLLIYRPPLSCGHNFVTNNAALLERDCCIHDGPGWLQTVSILAISPGSRFVVQTPKTSTGKKVSVPHTINFCGKNYKPLSVHRRHVVAVGTNGTLWQTTAWGCQKFTGQRLDVKCTTINRCCYSLGRRELKYAGLCIFMLTTKHFCVLRRTIFKLNMP